MGVEYGFCQCAGFEQGKTEDNRIGGKGKYRAVQIVCDYHIVYQYGVNTDTYHNEEALKTKALRPKGQKMTGGLKSIRGKQESGSQKGFRFPAFLA